MTSYINVFLKTEITVIPGLLDKYIGKYYNNTLCNGATWMFLSWYLLHVIFDNLLNALLRRMKYKEYIRTRLKRTLWYLGFYGTACLYCSATLFRNNIQFFDIKKPFDSTNTSSGHLILGFIILVTFYLHSAFWERLKYGHAILASSYLCLFLLLFFSYFLRFVEGTFRLTILICYTQIALELAQCVTIKKEKFTRKNVTCLFFAFSVFTFIINYFLVLPILLGYPLVMGLSPAVSILLSFLLVWLILEIYDSVLFKSIFHWLNHKDETKKYHCDGDIFECSLFPPRNDATYNFLILKKEMKDREEMCMSLRKPKNRSMVVQTLKCMVAIKRKLNEKRHATNLNSEHKSTNEHSQEIEENGTTSNKAGNINNEANSDVVDGRFQFNIQGNENNDQLNYTNKCKED